MGQRKSKAPPPAEDEIEETTDQGPFRKIVLLGSRRDGKSTLVKSFQDQFSDQDFSKAVEESLQHLLTSLFEALPSDDLSSMLINVPEDVIHSNMKHLLMNRSSDITDGNIDLRTLFIWLWKNPNMRELIFTNISDRWIPHTNIELFAQKITQREMPCNPYLYIGRPTCGVSEIKIIHNNLQYITLELGGDRYQRRRWIHCFEKVHCFVVVASLTDFTDPYWFDESLAYYAMLCDNKWTCGKRIVLVLSKVDILVNKLRNGSIAYNRQLNTVVRKELAHVENDCQQRIIINSIISEYFQIYNSKTSRKWAFEYHIANLVSPVDSKQLKRRIFNDVQPETPYISDSLSPNFIRLHLTKHCNGSLPRFCDIVMVTKLGENDY